MHKKITKSDLKFGQTIEIFGIFLNFLEFNHKGTKTLSISS
jgi:hypothetical protein